MAWACTDVALGVGQDDCVLYPNALRDLLIRVALEGRVRALPDAMVRGYESLIEGLSLPDFDDRHVLTAAIKAAAQVIVTVYLKNFPDSALTPFGIEAKSPDDFLLDQFHISESVVRSAVLRE